jgi:iron complex outermembrane receptor protein
LSPPRSARKTCRAFRSPFRWSGRPAQGRRRHAVPGSGQDRASLTIRPAEHPANANVSLRGVGTFAFGIGVEPSVAVLVDEVPLAFQARAFTDLPDVERIEVLRGPQSTLYGKSASAGLINIITREPTDTFHARANILATTDSEVGGNVSISGPLAQDLGYVLSASYSKWDGNVHNLYNGKTVNGRETVNLRGKIRYEPSSDVKITLSGNYVNGTTTVGRPFIRMAPGALLRNTAGQTVGVTMPGVNVNPENQDISNNYDSRTKYGGGGSLRGEFGLGDLTLISITSYDKFRLNDYLDHDDTSSTLPIGSNIQVGAFNAAVHAGSPPALARRQAVPLHGRRLLCRCAVRAAVLSRPRLLARQLVCHVQVAPGCRLRAGGLGIHAQGHADGGRPGAQNEKIAYTFQDNLAAAGSQFFSGGASKTAGTYRISARYEFTPDLMVFATYSTGYKGQTYDLTTGFNAARAAAGPLLPERSRDIEVVHACSSSTGVTVNLTYFDTTYKNLQAQSIETIGGTQNFRLTNVGKLGTKGVELDTSARTGDLSLNWSLAYLDAKYLSYPTAQCYPLQTAATGCISGSPNYQNLTGARAAGAEVEVRAGHRVQPGADRHPARRGPAQLAASEQPLLRGGRPADVPAGLFDRQYRAGAARRGSPLGTDRVHQQPVRQAVLRLAGQHRQQLWHGAGDAGGAAA